jgi:hypothetical protein
MTELIITELDNKKDESENELINERYKTREQGCQTMSNFDKSTEMRSFPITNLFTERKTNYIENKRLFNYYRKRNQQTDIFNSLIENESQRERLKKSIINEYIRENNEVPKWILNIKK